MKRTLIGIYALGLLGLLGSSVLAQTPNVPVFSMWATEVTDGMGGPNKCTSCPTQNVPLGQIAPGDVVRIELFVSTWDSQPGRGFCDGDPAQGQAGQCTNIGSAAPCPGKHCANNGASCATDLNCTGSSCIQNICTAFPRVGAYTATVLGSSFFSGQAGQFSLYQIPCDPADCSVLTDGTCPCAHFYQQGSDCTCTTSVCSASTNLCDRNASALIEKSRPDNIFFGKASFEIMGFSPLGDIDFSSVLLNSLVDGVVDNGTRKHLGSMILEASSNAGGTFTISFFKDPNTTFVVNANAGIFDGQVYNDLIINLPPPITMNNCTMITTASPTDCEVDGRQPHDIASAVPPQGITSIDVTFSNPCNAATDLSPSNFALTLTPAGGTPPTVTNVAGSGNTATLTLSAPIPPGKWTCVTSNTAPGGQTCVGFLPGDVNANLIANTADVTAAINSLNGTVPEPPIATDTNRSSIHTAEDLVRLLDLFNGGGAYSPLLNTTLPPCP